jgi:spore germination cell wall hydrolase CwlJ-like protein
MAAFMTPALALQPMLPWHTHPRETAVGAMLGMAALLVLAGASGATPVLPEFARQAPPAPPPMEVRNLAPEAAVALNSQIPVAGGPNPAAAPFVIAKASSDARGRALECLTSAIYYEAGQESADGQRAVAQVVLNRVRHPAFPNSICGVVYEGSTRVTGCQFTFTCDGSMTYRPVPALWNRAKQIAAEMLAGRVYAPVGHATHYHAYYVVPYWASSLVKTTVEGAHIFYRWAGGWGRQPAFTDRWSAREGNPAALRLAALTAPRPTPEVATAEATIDKLEDAGAKVTAEAGGRIRVLFTPEARAAAEKVKVTPYAERVAASDNLRYALDGGAPAASQSAFGPPPKPVIDVTAATPTPSPSAAAAAVASPTPVASAPAE